MKTNAIIVCLSFLVVQIGGALVYAQPIKDWPVTRMAGGRWSPSEAHTIVDAFAATKNDDFWSNTNDRLPPSFGVRCLARKEFIVDFRWTLPKLPPELASLQEYLGKYPSRKLRVENESGPGTQFIELGVRSFSSLIEFAEVRNNGRGYLVLAFKTGNAAIEMIKGWDSREYLSFEVLDVDGEMRSMKVDLRGSEKAFREIAAECGLRFQ